MSIFVPFLFQIANVILMCERCKTSLKEFQNHLVTYKRLKGDGEVVEQVIYKYFLKE